MIDSIFNDLFVLELANNHWGSLERGIKIVDEFVNIIRKNKVKASIKLQFRDVDNFIQEQFIERKDIRYIKKTIDTKLSYYEFAELVQYIKKMGCITMATPFDEKSVDMCESLNIDIIKIASSDIKDWVLIRKIVKKRKPVIVSTGGASLQDIDRITEYFNQNNIPLAINHCVSLYPSEDSELQIHQIDFLKNRYPDNVIGFSTHEYQDWSSSMLIAYAKGARTFERHIDIEMDDIPVSPYCSLPEQVDVWFNAFHKAKEMCGLQTEDYKMPDEKEIRYLDSLVRGVYAKKDLEPGTKLDEDNVYFAVPLQKGQISSREFDKPIILTTAILKNEPIDIMQIDTNYYESNDIGMIKNRGI